MARGARLLVVGLDGASPDLVQRFVAEGRMPVLAGLCRDGASGRLRSTQPPCSLPAWSSILTGVNPGRHGLFDFVQRIPGTYRLRFVHGGDRRAPGFLGHLSDAGARVCSLLVPGTWPPKRLNGVVVSGFDSPVALTADAAACEPVELWAELSRRFGGLAYAGFQELRAGPGWHSAALASMLAEIRRKEQVCEWLLDRERWDAFMVVLGESDTVGHHFWMFHDRHSPRHPPGAPAELRGALERIYGRLDQALGRLLDRAKPDVVCVLSDHGMGGAGRLAVYLNRYLESRGLLRFRHDRGGRGRGGLARVARGAALRGLPPHAQQWIFRRAPRGLVESVETRSRYGDIDFARTIAFSDECSYAATVHLNLQGREPRGQAKDRDVALREVEDALLDWRVGGERVVERVHRREAVYQGPWLEGAADLVLELRACGGYATTLLPSAEVPPGTDWRLLDPEELVGGRARGMNGVHRRHGVLVLCGPGAHRGAKLEDPVVEDVAGSVLAMSGWIPPVGLDGRVLCAPPSPPARSLPRARHAPGSGARAGRDWALLRRRLRGLGYLGDRRQR